MSLETLQSESEVKVLCLASRQTSRAQALLLAGYTGDNLNKYQTEHYRKLPSVQQGERAWLLIRCQDVPENMYSCPGNCQSLSCGAER